MKEYKISRVKYDGWHSETVPLFHWSLWTDCSLVPYWDRYLSPLSSTGKTPSGPTGPGTAGTEKVDLPQWVRDTSLSVCPFVDVNRILSTPYTTYRKTYCKITWFRKSHYVGVSRLVRPEEGTWETHRWGSHLREGTPRGNSGPRTAPVGGEGPKDERYVRGKRKRETLGVLVQQTFEEMSGFTETTFRAEQLYVRHFIQSSRLNSIIPPIYWHLSL